MSDFPFEFSERPGMERSVVYTPGGPTKVCIPIPKSHLNGTQSMIPYSNQSIRQDNKSELPVTRENLLLKYEKEHIGGLNPAHLYGVLDTIDKALEDATTLKGKGAISALQVARMTIMSHAALYNVWDRVQRYNAIVESLFAYKEIKIPEGVQNNGSSTEKIGGLEKITKEAGEVPHPVVSAHQ